MLEYVSDERMCLDPGAIHFYDAEFDIHNARIGDNKITGVSLYWDPSSARQNHDGSVCALVYRDDERRNIFVHDVIYMMVDDDMMTRWAMYANTPMETEVKAQLYPQLVAQLKGLSQKEAVERILNWVQTGFEYEYDNKAWGHDRAFFTEETLFYPYCDCEDRSILLTRLVRDLLHLKCILVYYPGHLASAVELTGTDAKGDCIMLDGHKYIIADGTYINAPLGRTMPQMDNSTAKVILLE